MPSNDEINIVPVLTSLASGDKVQVCDVSEGSGKDCKAITVANLIETALDTIAASDGTGVAVGDHYIDSTTGVLTRKLA